MSFRTGNNGSIAGWSVQASIAAGTIGNVVKNTGTTLVIPATENGLGGALEATDRIFAQWEPTASVAGVVLTGLVTPFLGTVLIGLYNTDNAADKDLTLVAFIVNLLVMKSESAHT